MNKTWIFTCNPNKYRGIEAFSELESVDWSTNSSVSSGDIVYIYFTSPDKKIYLKTQVIKDNVLKSEEIDDAKFIIDKLSMQNKIGKAKRKIRLKLLKQFSKEDSNKLCCEVLVEKGLNTVALQRPIILNNNKLFEYIQSVDNDKDNDNEIELLHDIMKHEISSTEKEQIIKARVGQEIFKDKLLNKECKCKICGVTNKNFLIASHIKPWANCTDEERIDENNGFLLCPAHDSVFDKGYITFDNDGKIIISNYLDDKTQMLLNVHENIRVYLNNQNIKYLNWHRNNVFEKILVN